jgi:endonuclease III
MDKQLTNLLIQRFGQRYSEILGINLKSEKKEEVFKWFLASILFGAPITEGAVIKTYKCFEKHKVLTPEKILETGWDGLVEILDEGSYTRYDFKTADKLLAVMDNLTKKYDGNLNLLHEQASDSFDLEKRLKDLGKGVGEITVSIFLRELRGTWKKADPEPTPLVVLAARNLGITEEEKPDKALEDLKEFWKENEISGKDFVNFETVLLRFGKDFCRKKKCDVCGFREVVSCRQVVA